MPADLWLKAFVTGLLLAWLQQAGGSVAIRPDPYGLVALGLAPGDGGPVPVPLSRPAGDLGAGLDAFERGDPDVAMARLVRAVLVDPGDRDARRALGALLLGLQDYEAALGQFKALDRQRPDDAETLYQLAWAHRGLGQSVEALACAQEVVAQRPHWVPGRVRLGLVLREAGDREGAAAELRRASANPSITADTLLEIGNHHLDLGQPAEAVPVFERALALRPDHSWAANNLGNAYKQLGRPEQARAAYQRAIAADAMNPNPHNGLGVLREAHGDFAGALASYRAAIAIDPDYVDARFNAGVVLLRQGKAKEALTELEAARRLRPDFAATYMHMGAALLKLGRLDQARANYRKAVAMDPALRRTDDPLSRTLGGEAR